jgi:hypothetical protein
MKEIRRFLQWVAVLTVCLISFAGFTFAQAFNSSPSGDAVASESAAPIRALLAQVADALQPRRREWILGQLYLEWRSDYRGRRPSH